MIFEPVTIGGVRLRNRLVKAAAFEGMCPGGEPSAALVEHHRRVAAGGVGLCTVAYAAVSPGGRTFAHQMWMRDDIKAGLRRVTDAIHKEGAAASIQLGHAGCMADAEVTGETAIAPSRVPNLYALNLPRAMEVRDIDALARDFARSALLARESGFDAVEIQAGHGYLISQFLSPYTNRRRDRFGGSLENRARMLVSILRAVRDAASDIAVTVKMNVRDGFEGGFEREDAVEVARMVESEGVDAIQLSGGFASKTPWYILRGEVPWKEIVEDEPKLYRKVGMALFGRLMVEPFPMREAYFLDHARVVRKAVDVPLMLVGGIRTRATIDRVLDDGFDLVAMARPLIRDPDFPKKLAAADAKSNCVPCNRCVAAMYHAEQHCPLS